MHNLQKRLAIRVLSQDCAVGPCERNWSTWALFHTKKRNKLTTLQLERLVFCNCNLQLLDRLSNSPEPTQVNVDKIDIEKVRDIPDIPQEERDLYALLYEEAIAPVHDTRRQRQQRRGRRIADVGTSAAAGPSESSSSASSEESHEDEVQDEIGDGYFCIHYGDTFGPFSWPLFKINRENILQVFSMPETTLGLHPDVGASYFLSRLPGYLGEYLGLTGARLDGVDMLGCGLATHFVMSESLPDLEKSLWSFDTESTKDISAFIDQFTVNAKLQEKSPLHRSAEINRCFSKVTVEEILEALSCEENNCHGWYKASAESLRKASPVSLKVTLKSIREGRHQSLADCLIREYRLSVRCVFAKLSTDLYEGIRSILIDKDRNPKWSPLSLELTSSEIVNHYFSPLKADEGQELQLPIQHNATSGISRL
ncbi:hypothetical protein L7F22_049045 [Adiantum nelumboides]|nr:hypothetical protein [Adiantum nelumboides]